MSDHFLNKQFVIWMLVSVPIWSVAAYTVIQAPVPPLWAFALGTLVSIALDPVCEFLIDWWEAEQVVEEGVVGEADNR